MAKQAEKEQLVSHPQQVYKLTVATMSYVPKIAFKIFTLRLGTKLTFIICKISILSEKPIKTVFSGGGTDGLCQVRPMR